MSHKQQQAKKKKARERAAHHKVLSRRMAMRRERKIEKEKDAAFEKEFFERREDPTLTPEQRAELLRKITGKAVKNLTDNEVKERDEALIAKMKANIAYLEELEKAMIAEQESRARTNKILETSGAVTLEDKMKLLHEQQTQKEGICLAG